MLADRIGVMSARPGRLIDIVETGWPRERDSRIVAGGSVRRHHGAAVAHAAGGVAQGHRQDGVGLMTRAALYPYCVLRRCRCSARGAVPRRHDRQADHAAAASHGHGPVAHPGVRLAQCGHRQDAVQRGNGLCPGHGRRRLPAASCCTGCGWCAKRSIRCLRPTTPFPIFAFYPLLIILFGLGDAPQILIGFMLGVVAVIVNTLNGLDRVPRILLKTAEIEHMGPVETACEHHRCPMRRPTS